MTHEKKGKKRASRNSFRLFNICWLIIVCPGMKKKKESRIGAKDLCRTETLCKMEVVCNCCVYQSQRDRVRGVPLRVDRAEFCGRSITPTSLFPHPLPTFLHSTITSRRSNVEKSGLNKGRCPRGACTQETQRVNVINHALSVWVLCLYMGWRDLSISRFNWSSSSEST